MSDDFKKNYNEEDEESWDIIYPSHVYDIKTDRAKDVKAEGFKSGMTLLVFFSFLGFLALNAILKNSFGVSSFWAFIIVFILISVIAVIVFRFVIFKEDERVEEFENEEIANLGRYFKLINTTEDTEDIRNLKIPTYKFISGEYATCLRFTHGSCDALKRVETRTFMEELITIIGRHNLDFKQVIMDEVFDDSQEYRDYINIINNIEIPEMQRNARLIAEGLLSMTRNYSRVDCTYIIIYARNSYEKQFLISAIVDIDRLYKRSRTVYRNMELLPYKSFIEVCKQYLGVEMIDLGTIRTTGANSRILAQYANAVETVEIETLDGSKIQYKSKTIDKAVNSKIKDL